MKTRNCANTTFNTAYNTDVPVITTILSVYVLPYDHDDSTHFFTVASYASPSYNIDASFTVASAVIIAYDAYGAVCFAVIDTKSSVGITKIITSSSQSSNASAPMIIYDMMIKLNAVNTLKTYNTIYDLYGNTLVTITIAVPLVVAVGVPSVVEMTICDSSYYHTGTVLCPVYQQTIVATIFITLLRSHY